MSYTKDSKIGAYKDFKSSVKAEDKLSHFKDLKIGGSKELKEPAKNNTRARDLKCFKCHGLGHYASDCPNNRVMVLQADGEFESEDEKLEEPTEVEVVEPPTGPLLVTIRALSVMTKSTEQRQRENLFHTRCVVNGKVCSLIVDGGSCTNIASQTMVQKLGLKELPHPKPYKLHWLNEDGELAVSKQVKVSLAIGKYEDEILCDIAPLEASHILLGRPWQSDRRVIHDGFTNRHSFDYKGRKIILAPMAPHEVYLDQLSMKKKPLPEPPSKKTKPRTEGSDSSNLLMVSKENMLNITNLKPAVPSSILTVLQDFQDVFPEDNPPGLPPIRGIEHQIDFVPGAVLPNKPAYRTNPTETKELETQVNELLERYAVWLDRNLPSNTAARICFLLYFLFFC